MYKAYVTILTNVRKHPNADRLLLADVFGNTVCVSTDYIEGQLGVYFPTDGQLSVEFAEKNNLVRKKDDAGNNIGGYLEPDKRNIRAIRLRGEKSDGIFLPISCLNYCYAHGDASIELRAGDVIDGLVNGHEICHKYIPRTQNRVGRVTEGNKTRKYSPPTAPLFKEHADTEQLAYNLGAFKPGDHIEVSLKMHGTSQRTGYLPVFKGHKRTFLDWLFRRQGTPVYEYGYVSGTRRVVLENYEGGFYGNNEFREQHSKTFEGKLWKGETVYYEVVGFTTSGAPIMGDASNKKLNDKEFVKQYGEITRFSYGCHPDGTNHLTMNDGEGDPFYDPRPQSDIYVYRMTMTNPDGEVVEYTPDFMRYRCEQMAVKCVPVFWNGIIPEVDEAIYVDKNDNDERDEGETAYVRPVEAGEWVRELAEQYYDGPDPVGKTHVREGVVVRIINRPKFCAYKHKNWSFKCLSGIAVADAEASGTTEGMSEDMLAEM